MEKYELEDSLKEEIRSRTLGEGFIKLVQSVRRGGERFRISLRPVEIGGVRKYQAEMSEGRDVQVKNFDANGAAEGVEEIIAQKGARELHLITATGDLHVRVTKKGHVLVSRSSGVEREAVVRPHDRVKNLPLSQFDSAAYLKAADLAETVGPAGKDAARPFTAVDFGCGKAYLTVALYFYLVHVLGYSEAKVVGVDRRADVVGSARKMAEKLDVADRVEFVESDIGAYNAESVDLVVSLHACDTATDESIAKGVEMHARYILSAPCCQHELQKTIGPQSSKPFAGLLRQGILRERLCDILTDAFRAMILRILGYKVQVMEFVSSEATARNIMLKCEYGVKPGQPGPVGEYLELRDWWKVTPWLETRLAPLLEKHLSRYD
ncbi:MAG: SAM-dependent methyltransferase [Kiritimatiellae bacterium]|nr:SAM-dependent methyltransferase [Kiritimatiellia bacterium]